MDTSQSNTQKALSKAYTTLNFSKFCALIGEPEKYGEYTNAYAVRKWIAFQDLCNNMDILGSFFDRILEYGEKE